MTQYIDKNTAIAELEKLIDKGKYHDNYECAFRDGNNNALYALKAKINTLEVKEVDLVEELDYDDYMAFFKEHPEYDNEVWGYEETWAFGQYCYKLGIKVRKGE